MIDRSPLSQRPLYRNGPANENGATEPATPSSIAPAPAFFSRSRLVMPSWASGGRSAVSDMYPPSSPSDGLAECSARASCDEPIQKRVVYGRERDAREHACRQNRG